MFNAINLLANSIYDIEVKGEYQAIYFTVSISLIVLMAIAAIALIVLVLLQQSNSSGIDALGGSSETFFGKHKGKSVEAQMKKWTWICLAVLVVLSITFCVFLKVFGLLIGG